MKEREPIAPQSPRRILIVEDEPTSLKLTQVVLQAEGYSVHIANSAEKALEAIDILNQP